MAQSWLHLLGILRIACYVCCAWKDNYTILLSCGITASSRLLCRGIYATNSLKLGPSDWGKHHATTRYLIFMTILHALRLSSHYKPLSSYRFFFTRKILMINVHDYRWLVTNCIVNGFVLWNSTHVHTGYICMTTNKKTYLWDDSWYCDEPAG